MKSVLTTKIYKFVWSKDSACKAEIVFKWHMVGGWKFEECRYGGVNLRYSLDNWEFLGELAQEIKELCEEVKNG